MNSINYIKEAVGNNFELKKKTLKEGTTPSDEQIQKWFQNGNVLYFMKKGAWGGLEPIQGKIKKILSSDEREGCFWIENHNFGISLQDIRYFKVEEVEEISNPLLVVSSLEPTKKTQTVFLVSGEEKWEVNKENLCTKIPYFADDFKESATKDVSEIVSSNQLKTILQYLDGLIEIDSSNRVDLFIASKKLLLEKTHLEVKEFFIENLRLEEISTLIANTTYPALLNFLNDIQNEIKTFYSKEYPLPIYQEIQRLLKGKKLVQDIKKVKAECRKNGVTESNSYLESEGIIDLLRIVKVLGAEIESLHILNVNDEDMPLLVQYLKKNSEIKSLNVSWGSRMSYDGLTDGSAPILIELIQSLPALQKLKIHNHNFSDPGLKILVDGLKNTSLQKVNFSIHFSSEGLSYLAEKLKNHSTIRSLYLVACGFGSTLEKNKEYIEVFSSNTTLKELYIGNNCIDDDGVKGFSKIIEKNTSLEVLDLWGNRISLEGRNLLIEALKKNSTLQKVRVNSVYEEQNERYEPTTISLRGDF